MKYAKTVKKGLIQVNEEVEEAKEILFKIKFDNESKAMIVHNNSSNLQITWSNEDLKNMAEISHRCAIQNRAIDVLLKYIKELEEQYISKTKIKDKIQELENIKLCADKFFEWQTENKIKLLKELLDERKCHTDARLCLSVQ